jgi:hypothetical protein
MPHLCAERYAFEAQDDAALGDSFALIREDEGLTVIRAHPNGEWARISLEVHSSLSAVGLTAALSSALVDAGIGANIIAALRHDHLFVPWDRREEALRCIEDLAS